MTFSPKLSGSAASFEQPVVTQTSGLEGGTAFLNLAAGAIEALKPAQPSAAQVREERDLGILNQYTDSLVQADQLRRQGFAKRAADIERNAAVVAGRAGADLNSSEYTSVYEQVTGLPSGNLGRTPEQAALMQAMETPEYQEAVVSSMYTHPDASPEERVSIAMSTFNRKNANAQTIEATIFDWNDRDGQASRQSLIADWRGTHLGAISEASKQGLAVSNDAIQQARNALYSFRTELNSTRPAGLPNESWQPIEDDLKNLENQLEYLESLTSVGEMTSDSTRAVSDALEGLYQQGGISAFDKNILFLEIKENPSAFIDRGIIGTDDLQGILKALSNTDPSDRINHDETTTFTPEELENVSQSSVTQQFEDAQKLASTGYGTKGGENWSIMTERAFANLHSMAADHDGWVTKDGYASVFTPALFKSMEDLKTSDPTAYEAVRGRGLQTIDAHLTAVKKGVDVRSDIVTYDRASNSVVFDVQNFMENKSIPAGVRIEFFRAWEASGKDIRKLISTSSGGQAVTVQTAMGPQIRVEGGRSDGVQALINRVEAELNDSNVLDRIDAVTALEGYKARLTPIEQTKDKGATQSSSSRHRRQRGSIKDSSLVSLIDETEGGGDYNTLFSFSNRAGGDFEGVNVSEMTIGDLMSFSNGEYGAWSKKKLGYKATPMGRYQIVGTTLAQTAKEMGISDNVVFTDEVQDAMFHHLVVKSLKGKDSPEAKRAALRGTWEGFHTASDAELDAAIADFEGTPVPSYTELQGSTAVGDAMVRPKLRPEAAKGDGDSATFSSVRPQARPTSSQDVATATQPKTGEATPSEGVRSPETVAKTDRVWSKLSDQTKNMLVRLFGNEEGAREAISSGEISEEDIN